MKKAGEKGWTDFQTFWSGPEEGAEPGKEPDSHQLAEGDRDGDREGEEEGVGDLLGSFSEDSTPSKQQQQTPPLGNRGFKSYGSTSYGSTGNTSGSGSKAVQKQPGEESRALCQWSE